MNYYNIAVPKPLQQPLTYCSPQVIKAGRFVEVPLLSKKITGLVLSQVKDKPDFESKEILKVFNDIPPLDPIRMEWINWLSQYYFYPIGMVASSCFTSPPSDKQRKKQSSLNPSDTPTTTSKLQLNKEQLRCVSEIKKISTFKVHLLHGVTGSGKTEVYLDLMENIIQQNKSVLFLLPEISLTPQLFQRVSARFPDQTALIHSGISPSKKQMSWTQAIEGKKKILMGARSALFCPIPNLSLIIVDEEHESHFKQEEKLKYHARDSAIMLGHKYNIPVVLGSATPSLETWHNVQIKRYQYHQLKKRVKGYPMPQMNIMDLKKQKNKELPFWLSEELFQALQNALKKKEQSALFLNRRGQSSLSLCSYCGSHLKCPHCDISLVLHSNKYLVCHYCNYSINSLQAECHPSQDIMHIGVGTESVFEGIKKLFPKANVQLADSDHIHSVSQFQSIVEQMLKGKTDILIGTQMIAKGLDFPKLNLVGFILADLALHTQDFRSTEKCFQLIAQMGGRAGRHSINPGKVIIQTYNPDHPAIQTGSRLEFEKMASHELKFRKQLNYPPFTRLALIQTSSSKKAQSLAIAKKIHTNLSIAIQTKNIQCLGPAPAPIFKLRSKYRYHILLKSSSAGDLHKVCESIWQKPSSTWQINRDPV